VKDKSDKPKWLKTLKHLLNSKDELDKGKLKETLDKLKKKSHALKEEIDLTDDPEKRQILIEQWEMVRKHRKKGIKKLKESND